MVHPAITVSLWVLPSGSRFGQFYQECEVYAGLGGRMAPFHHPFHCWVLVISWYSGKKGAQTPPNPLWL